MNDRAQEIVLHQRYLSALGKLRAAEADGDADAVRRLTPAVERAKTRWLKVNKRFVRGG